MDDTKQTVRQILAEYGRLLVPVSDLADDDNLYDAGMSSLATVGVMLALESQLDVEFAGPMLSRRTFRSIDTITDAVAELQAVPVGV